MSTRVLTVLLLALVAAAGGAGAGDLLDPDGDQDSAAGAGRVVKVVDGDTIHVRVGGARETVRYIGVDTPLLWSQRVIPSTAAATSRR